MISEKRKKGKETPLIRFYNSLKEEDPDRTILFCCEDCYLVISDDAAELSKALKIPLRKGLIPEYGDIEQIILRREKLNCNLKLFQDLGIKVAFFDLPKESFLSLINEFCQHFLVPVASDDGDNSQRKGFKRGWTQDAFITMGFVLFTSEALFYMVFIDVRRYNIQIAFALFVINALINFISYRILTSKKVNGRVETALKTFVNAISLLLLLWGGVFGKWLIVASLAVSFFWSFFSIRNSHAPRILPILSTMLDMVILSLILRYLMP